MKTNWHHAVTSGQHNTVISVGSKQYCYKLTHNRVRMIQRIRRKHGLGNKQMCFVPLTKLYTTHQMFNKIHIRLETFTNIRQPTLTGAPTQNATRYFYQKRSSTKRNTNVACPAFRGPPLRTCNVALMHPAPCLKRNYSPK